MTNSSFRADPDGLKRALDAVFTTVDTAERNPLPRTLPEDGLGEIAVLDRLAPIVLAGARHLGDPDAFAHMDPPTPWIAWVTTFWNASLNQNLLHPDVAPAARDLESLVIEWLAPYFGMDGGHMTSGSTLANLTALWAARERMGIKVVLASDAAYLSIAKSAHILGMDFQPVPVDASGSIDNRVLPSDLSNAALVLTAGTTSAGAIDDLGLAGRAAWTHVDAAWAGPLRLSKMHRSRLDGIERADSVAVSAHKWFFQPKESGLIFFRDTERAHQSVSYGGAYLAVPNVGVLGSHGAVAISLLATLFAWGRSGFEQRVEQSMRLADTLWERLREHPMIDVFGPQTSGVVLWRPRGVTDLDAVFESLPIGSVSKTSVDGRNWFRHVAANPNADIDLLWDHIERAMNSV